MTEKKIILVVDDTPENILVLKGILVSKYTILAAKSAPAAIEVINKKRPDLILLDIMMPGMDGYELCRHLKSNIETAEIPIIFVSAMADIDDESKGFSVGAVDYITKPVTAELVKARVRTHLILADQQRACEIKVSERTAELKSAQRAAINMLGEAGHYNDTDTGVHIWRMAAYSRALATQLRWSVGQAILLEQAAAMHDTGKIGISDEILKAPRKLNADEWKVMKTHSQIGYQILSKSDSPIFKLAAEIALSHHEKWDGSGYPNGISNIEIPVSARIVAIADVYDALTMVRPYKKAWSNDQAIELLKSEAGKQFDPEMVVAFVEINEQILLLKHQWENLEAVK